MYDLPYFNARKQDKDRPALWFYERLARRWFQQGQEKRQSFFWKKADGPAVCANGS